MLAQESQEICYFGISRLCFCWNPQILQDCSNCVDHVHKYCIRGHASWGRGVFCLSHVRMCVPIMWSKNVRHLVGVPLDFKCLHLQRGSSVWGGQIRRSLCSCCRRHLPLAFSIAVKQWRLWWHSAWYHSRGNSFTGVNRLNEAGFEQKFPS